MLDFLKALLYNQHYPLIFNSVLFIILFTAFYSIYIIVFKKENLRNFILLIFSLYFYYKISGLFVLLLVFIASTDFFIAKAIYNNKSDKYKKMLLAIALLIDIGALAFFKYTNFFLYSVYGIFDELPPMILNIALPLGISFYIFKTLTYIFDVYREEIEQPEKNYLKYVLYVSFFPNILAGPISKARELIPQLSDKLKITNEFIGKGLMLILIGAFKKICIADMLANNFVDRVFDSPEFFTGIDGVMAMYCYTMQIYFDFSGYTDIVIGLSFLLGIQLMPNFNKPFLAQNVTDFWRRWHMTLSSWLNEYVFYPLSFSFRKFKMWGVILAVMITFIISGLWHGPSWTYILWGISHGLAIALTVLLQNVFSKIKKNLPGWLYSFFSVFITFHFLALSMILFRSNDLNAAWKMYSLIFTPFTPDLVAQWINAYFIPFVLVLLAFILHYSPIKLFTIGMNYFVKSHWVLKVVVFFIGIILIYQAYSSDTQPFIYLEF